MLPGSVVTTWAVVTEALYLLGVAANRRHGDTWYGQEPLACRVLAGSGVGVADFTAPLGARSLALMATYGNVPMDFADASLVALAEQKLDRRIVTFDSDFRVYRTLDGQPLLILDGAR